MRGLEVLTLLRKEVVMTGKKLLQVLPGVKEVEDIHKRKKITREISRSQTRDWDFDSAILINREKYVRST
jgi:hypothetical protein